MNVARIRGRAAAAPSRLGRRLRVLIAFGVLATILQPAPAMPEAHGAGSAAAREDAVPKPEPAEPATVAANARVLDDLQFTGDDYADAERGWIATLEPEVTIRNDDGVPVFSLADFAFLDEPNAPASVNPSLWRHARVNRKHGLFEVTRGVYQVRNFDLANVTFVEGQTGVIVIDPLSSIETARAALDLYRAHRGERPVKAIVYTHSHHDHYAGVKGLVSDADVASGAVTVLAPEGFLEAAISENVYAGTAMGRRAIYMFAYFLPKSERGTVDDGLAKTQSLGTASLIAPTDTIRRSGETRTIDGVSIEFVMAPGTEAPAEMTLYFPELALLDAAEIACPLMHNVLTPRGAQVRDPRKWAESLDELIARYGGRTEILIGSHNWPKWRQDTALQLLRDERDLYKFLNDQTLHLVNQGYTPLEIAETFRLPKALAQRSYARGYYGALRHNVKAVYQRYLGWFDGNPANLDPLPPVEAGRKLLEYMGGSRSVVARARQDFRKGEYRWVAQLMNQVVFAEPGNVEARHLQAAALEQLGYQAESAIWRNFYLMGAQELRQGIRSLPKDTGRNADTVRAMTIPLLFDYWGVLLNAEKAEGQQMVLNFTFPDLAVKDYALTLSNCALTHRAGALAPKADAGFRLARTTLDAILTGETDFATELKAGHIQVVGDWQLLASLLAMLDRFDPMWPIVTP